MSAEEIRVEALHAEHIGILSKHVLCSWPSTKHEVQKEQQLYWSFRDAVSIIDGITMKGSIIIIGPASLQDKSLKHGHLNYMSIKKIKTLSHGYIHLINMNAGIEEAVKIALRALISNQYDKDNTISHKYKGADVFTINNKHFHCIVDYHVKFPFINHIESRYPNKTCKIIVSNTLLYSRNIVLEI